MSAEARASALGLVIPAAVAPIANYVAFVMTGSLLFVSGQIPIVDGVVAWQVLYLTMLGRQLPDIACTAVLEAQEWQALYCFIHQVATPPTTPPTLQQATRWIAQLGGFLGRKADGHPGVTTLWRGLQRLHDITTIWQLVHPPPKDVGND